MSREWIRRPSRLGETLGAALVAAGVAAASLYVARLLLSRDPLPARPAQPPVGPEPGAESPEERGG